MSGGGGSPGLLRHEARDRPPALARQRLQRLAAKEHDEGSGQPRQFTRAQQVIIVLGSPSQSPLRLEISLRDEKTPRTQLVDEMRKPIAIEIIEEEDRLERSHRGQGQFQIVLQPGNVEVLFRRFPTRDGQPIGVPVHPGDERPAPCGGQTVAPGATGQIQHPVPRLEQVPVPGKPRARPSNDRIGGAAVMGQAHSTSFRVTPGSAAGRPFDLLVIGGGITGAGVARDAAMRGLTVALVDRQDFGAGTSSRSSRLVHGGLRYLEQFRWALVFEALAERRILLRIAPHLVRPLAFALPVHRGDRVPRWKLGLGLLLYDLLALGGNVRPHRQFGKRGFLAREPLIRANELRGGAVYWDAQCDDARLVIATIRSAMAHGAAVSNYAAVRDLVWSEGRVDGAVVADELTGAIERIQAHVVINATGPWTDHLRRLEDQKAIPLLRPTKGAHVLVRTDRIGHRHAITLTSPIDGRVMFVLPWGEHSYIGTTDTDSTVSPDEVAPDEEDVRYLLRSVNALFPMAHLSPDDVLAGWAGLRPLLAADPDARASDVSREHRIVEGSGRMLTVAGGKLTTYRRMATDVVDHAIRLLPPGHPGRHAKPSRTDIEPLPGGESPAPDLFLRSALEAGLDEATAAHLVRHYGAETPAVANLVREKEARRVRLHPGHPAIAAEVVFAARRELAQRLDDVLVRRLHLYYETPDHGLAAIDATAALLGAELSWSAERMADETTRYRRWVSESRRFGASEVASPERAAGTT